jgi:hypothetical protein
MTLGKYHCAMPKKECSKTCQVTKERSYAVYYIIGHTPRLDARNLRRMVGLINRGTTELVQHFPYRWSSHRRRSAA